MRVKVNELEKYIYPDIVVVCGDIEMEKTMGVETLLNPVVIIEILSRSAEAYTRGKSSHIIDFFPHLMNFQSQIVFLLIYNETKIAIGFSCFFGVLHFMIVGIPFMVKGGGGEDLLYIVLIDLPLYIVGEIAFQRLLLHSVPFNFLQFVVIGTLMYILLGYFIGVLIQRVVRKH